MQSNKTKQNKRRNETNAIRYIKRTTELTWPIHGQLLYFIYSVLKEQQKQQQQQQLKQISVFFLWASRSRLNSSRYLDNITDKNFFYFFLLKF